MPDGDIRVCPSLQQALNHVIVSRPGSEIQGCCVTLGEVSVSRKLQVKEGEKTSEREQLGLAGPSEST